MISACPKGRALDHITRLLSERIPEETEPELLQDGTRLDHPGAAWARTLTEAQRALLRPLGALEEMSVSREGKDTTVEQQHESDLVKRLEQLGIEVVVSPTVTTLTYEQIYPSGTTLEEAVATFLGEALSRYEALRKWKATMR